MMAFISNLFGFLLSVPLAALVLLITLTIAWFLRFELLFFLFLILLLAWSVPKVMDQLSALFLKRPRDWKKLNERNKDDID